ncbi:MAG TPA: hypothetical protein VK995_06035 [Oceanipulchritudo sp.]|nr:hypothetical protein [Oceanipulchritudo sp.]
MKHDLRTVFVFMVTVIASITAHAADIPPIMKVTYAGKLSSEPVLVQVIAVPGVSTEAVQDAIVRAASNRKWTVETLDDGTVQTKLVHRANESTLTFKVKNEKIEIYSVSYKIDKKTQARKGREEPEGWIRNLHKDILALLGLLPKS